jgi:hypothetical protein
MKNKIKVKPQPKQPKKVPHVTPTPLVSVINQSKRVSDADAARMVAANAKQLALHVSPYHGLVPALEFVKTGGTPTPGGSPCYIIDEPDIDGALGYHDEGADGVPYIKVFANPVLDNGGGILSGSLAISTVLSHELVELTGDGPANRWADGPDGNDFAYELADAVQDTWYVIDGVAVSNFLLQAFFDPKAQKGSKLDYLGKLTKPFSMTSGGYQITRTEPGNVSQVFGAHTRHTAEGNVHVHFGADFPEWRKAATVEKVRQKRAR